MVTYSADYYKAESVRFKIRDRPDLSILLKVLSPFLEDPLDLCAWIVVGSIFFFPFFGKKKKSLPFLHLAWLPLLQFAKCTGVRRHRVCLDTGENNWRQVTRWGKTTGMKEEVITREPRHLQEKTEETQETLENVKNTKHEKEYQLNQKWD